MYEKEIILIGVNFIFLRKLTSRDCVVRGPKVLKIDFGGGWQAVPCSRLYGPGFLDCWAIGPRVKIPKVITHFVICYRVNNFQVKENNVILMFLIFLSCTGFSKQKTKAYALWGQKQYSTFSFSYIEFESILLNPLPHNPDF